jgi:hypothetical protein
MQKYKNILTGSDSRRNHPNIQLKIVPGETSSLSDTVERTDIISNVLTSKAFSVFRKKHGPARTPPVELIANADEVTGLKAEDGLCTLVDGTVSIENIPAEQPRMINVESLKSQQLWVVRLQDVVHAIEGMPVGLKLESGVIKHSNLTAGGQAFAGGELIVLDENTIVINGRSGRYGPRSTEEMADVAIAFRRSGYRIWSMGFDEEAGYPFPFIGVLPQWVA